MQIFGTNIPKLNYKDFLKKITKLEKSFIVFTPNPEILLKVKTDNEFQQMIQKADYLTIDGIGLYIGFQILDNQYSKNQNLLLLPYYFFNLFFRKKYLYKKYGERICGSDMTNDILHIAVQKKIRITIIDIYNPNDTKKVASQKTFSQTLKTKMPGLLFDYYIYNDKEQKNIKQQIKKSNSQILFSTLGAKKQEQSVIDILNTCPNIKLGLGIGSSFDYIIGFQKRAPKIWRSLGLEWLYRLLTGPRKTERIKRLYNAIFIFLREVLKEK